MSWAQDTDSRKLVSGYVFDMNGGVVLWSLTKQPIVATSTVEAEYITPAHVTKEAIWLCSLLAKLDFLQTLATIIHSDSQGCIALSNNPISHSQAKHIDIWYYFIHECTVPFQPIHPEM